MPTRELVAEQFDDAEQQKLASTTGMWTFLATEVLFFGGMFTCYVEYRTVHHAAFLIGSHHMEWWLGTTNTAVLLISSFTMASAVRAAKLGKNGATALLLIVTMILGAAFLGLKGTEYYLHWKDGWVPGPHFAYHGTGSGPVQIFMSFYFVMTGMHALHMTIGLGLLTVMLLMTASGRFSAAYNTPIAIAGLYWHFVDLVWIFLFPTLYLL